MIGRGNLWSWGPCPPLEFREPEIKIDLEPSLYYKKRQSLINSKYVPPLKEAEVLIGKLARLVYEECDVGLRHLIEQTNEGPPYGDMWDSPSDLIKEKYVLKSPPTKRHMKDLNHAGIMAIGGRIEQKFLQHMYKEREEALKNQGQQLLDAFEKSIEDQINEAKNKERIMCAEKAEEFLKTFQQKMALELKKIKRKIKKDYGGMTTDQNTVIKQGWKAKIKEAVKQTTKNITMHFLEELCRQEEMMAISLRSELTKCEIERKFVIEKGHEEFKLKLKMMRHYLQCKNIVNMMYILCMERHKCFEEADALKKNYKEGIHESMKVVTKNKERLTKMKNDINQILRELKLRETCILEVLNQYQKFIKVALKQAPVHAKFLLSIEKLLLFELTETLSKIKPCTKSILPSSVSTTETEVSRLASDVAKTSVKESVISSKKEEPPFIFENKLYVKEDFNKFKELLSKTIGDPNDKLWGEDAELYIKTLQESVPGLKITDSKLLALSKLMFPDKDKKNLSHRSSFIEFKLTPESQPCYDLMKEVPLNDAYRLRKLKNTYKSLKYIKPINELISPIDYSKIGISEKDPSLLATTDSTEMFTIKVPTQRRSSKNGVKEDGYPSKEPEEDEEREIQIKSYRGSLEHDDQSSPKKKESDLIMDAKKNAITKDRSGILPLEIRDSLILRQTSLIKQRCRSFSLTPKDSIDVKNESELSALLRKHSSKLISTRDSVAYLKESKLALLLAGVCSICHQRNGLTQYDKDYCCERCLKKISDDQVSVRQAKNEKTEPPGIDQLKQLKLSHVEVIEMDQISTKNVIVVPEPTIIDSDNSLVMGTGQHFKPARKPKENKSDVKVDPCQDLFKPSAEIEGDKANKEYLQNNNEFTKDRVRSFIKIIDTHPNLIKLFTSCQQ